MKYVVDLKGFNEKYKFPQQGEMVYIKPPLSEDESKLQINFSVTQKFPYSKSTHMVCETNFDGNDAGFGWVWLKNLSTKHYDYKMSIFDRRTIPGNTEIPHVGYSNLDAYHIIKCRETVRTGYALSNFFKKLYGLFS